MNKTDNSKKEPIIREPIIREPIKKDTKKFAYVDTDILNVRTSASTGSNIKTMVYRRTQLEIIRDEGEWLFVKFEFMKDPAGEPIYADGYVMKQFCQM